MNNAAYDESELDSLQEVVNIAMGQAAASLAKLFDSFIRLSVPYIQVLNMAEINAKISNLSKNDLPMVRQAFFNGVRGEAITIYKNTNFTNMAALIGLDGLNDEEVMYDINNILVGATLCGIAEQLGLDIGFNPPSQFKLSQDNNQYSRQLDWNKALFIEIEFIFQNKSFHCNMLLLMSENSLSTIKIKIQKLLENL